MNRDRIALFSLAATALLMLGGIAAGAILKSLPNDSQTLLGTIAGGLLVFTKDIVTTIRAAWTDERTTQLTDHLANAAPIDPNRPAGTKNDPVAVEEVSHDSQA